MQISIRCFALDIDGVLTDGSVSINASGGESKALSYHDIDAVFAAHRDGLHVALVTAEDTPWVDYLAIRLQVKDVIKSAKDKAAAVHELARQLGMKPEQICYMGDGDRDAPAIAAVGLGIAPANATPSAKSAARIVLHSAGGYGAVREAFALIQEYNRQGATRVETRLLPAAVAPVAEAFVESISVLQRTSDDLSALIARAGQILAGTIENGHKLLIMGSGDSAGLAQSLAAELASYSEKMQQLLMAIALADSTISGYTVFARQIEAIGRAEDTVIAISQDGNIADIVRGARVARQMGLHTIALTGRVGGELEKQVELCLCVPSSHAGHIQEVHKVILRILCGFIQAA